MALVVTRDGLKTEEQLIQEDRLRNLKVICFNCGQEGKSTKCCDTPIKVYLA